MGPLARCHAVELRARGTCPGSPGYAVRSAPGQLPALPRWIAVLAGPPPGPVTGTVTGAAARIGLVREDGQRAVAATIRSGFDRMGVAYEPPR
jgi:hypothetical protein